VRDAGGLDRDTLRVMKGRRTHAPNSRCDALGRAFKGSQLQLQIYVNRHRDVLEAAIRAALPALANAKRIEWVSPLETDAFREYRDAAFLHKVRLPGLHRDLATFWPARGPVWDGLAVVELATKSGVLLVEGKGYPDELYGGGCKATSDESRRLISKALEDTQQWLGLRQDARAWLGPLYQSANRLAYLYFLRRLGVEAWLLHVCFTDDMTHVPVPEKEWSIALRTAESRLGLIDTEYAAAVFLPAKHRAVLLQRASM